MDVINVSYIRAVRIISEIYYDNIKPCYTWRYLMLYWEVSLYTFKYIPFLFFRKLQMISLPRIVCRNWWPHNAYYPKSQNHKDETFSCKKSELDPASGVLGFHSYHFNVSVASIRSSIYDGEKAILDLPGKEIRFKRNETDQRHSNDKERQIGDYLKLFLWYFVLDRFSSQ